MKFKINKNFSPALTFILTVFLLSVFILQNTAVAVAPFDEDPDPPPPPPPPNPIINGYIRNESLPVMGCATGLACPATCTGSFLSTSTGFGWSANQGATDATISNLAWGSGVATQYQTLSITLTRVNVDDDGSGVGWYKNTCSQNCGNTSGSNCATNIYPNTQVWSAPPSGTGGSNLVNLVGTATNKLRANGSTGNWGGFWAYYQISTLVCNNGYKVKTLTECEPVGGGGTTSITGSGTAQLAIFDVSTMTGSMSSTPTSCIVPGNQSSCSVDLNWSINNTESNVSKITASGMTDITLNTKTVGGTYSGVASGAVVPLGGRTFYLYNNAKSLVPTSPSGSGLFVNATCAPGTGPVNGVCLYDFNAPSSVTASCSSQGTTGTFTWRLPAGYSLSYFRLYDNTTGGTPLYNLWSPETLADPSVPGTGLTTLNLPANSLTPGHTYLSRVHTRNSSGSWSTGIDTVFTCPIPTPASCGATHYSCTSGTNPSGSETGGTNVSTISQWTWVCDSNDGGASASCQELKKNPVFIEN